MRSYQAYTLGIALLLFALAVARTAWISRPIAYLIGLSGLTFLVQGWVVGSEGFSPMMSNAIVVAELLDIVWMVWLLVIAGRMQDADPRRPVADGRGGPNAIHTSSY
jgi:hypothetical protein